MIIKSIKLKNFHRIYGEFTFDCPIDNDKNITVIIGDNGTGKTTILRAFHWVFYGEVIEPLTIDEMLNKKRRSELNENETDYASVTIKLSDKGVDYIFTRKQRFRKNSDGSVSRIDAPEIQITNLSSNPPSKIPSQDFFENIIPKKLSSFFFFDGERIERLAKIDGKNEIKQAILDLLGLTNIKNIQDYLTTIKQEFTKELNKASSDDKNLENLTKDYSDVLEKITENNEKLKQIECDIKECEKNKAECEQFLKENNNEEINKLGKRREELDKENNEIDKMIEEDTLNIFKHISKNFKSYLIADSFPNIRKFLEEKRQKGQLPSDIKETFVNDLLESKTCICGREILPGTTEYNNLLNLKKTAGKQELDDCYSKLVSFINYSDNKTIKDSFFTEIDQYIQKESNCTDKKEDIKKELENIKKKLISYDDKLIRAREELKESIENNLDNLKVEQVHAQDYQRELSAKENDIKNQIDKIESKSKSVNIYKKALALTSNLETLNNECNKFFIDMTQQDMDFKLKEVFNNLTRKKDREPTLSKNFELQIVNKETQAILPPPSTGEDQITSLSFIGAIVSYAKDKKKLLDIMSNFSGGDYPIVMDSPFGYLGQIHKENVARGIPTLASQVIVIVSEEQWQGVIAENMYEKAGAIYEMQDGYTSAPDSEFTEIRRTL